MIVADFNPARPPDYDAHSDPWQPWMSGGYIDVITLPNPAAGSASVTHIVPGDVWEMPLRVTATLTADANVATRSVDVRILKDGVTDIAGLDNAQTIAASGQGIWIWERGQTIETSGQKGRKRSPMPDILLAPGGSMILRVTAVQAGDTLTNLQWTFMRWRNRPRRLAERATSELAL